MSLLSALYHGEQAADDGLTLDFERRCKSRLAVTLDSGAKAQLHLPRGTVLRDGDKLQDASGRIVVIHAAAEELLEARCATPAALARAAYHLGNRHVAVQIGAEAATYWLRLQHDHVLGHMLEGLGATVSHLTAPFEPESGAYGGHAGHHEHGHDHDHPEQARHGHPHGNPESAPKIHDMSAR